MSQIPLTTYPIRFKFCTITWTTSWREGNYIIGLLHSSLGPNFVPFNKWSR